MNRKGITRGDAIVVLAVVLIFIFSFFKYYEISVTYLRDSDDGNFLGGGGSTSSKGWNAWTADFYPLMPAVVLVPLLAVLLLVAGRFSGRPDHPVLGLAPRQWAIAFGVAAAISGFFAPFGAGAAIGDMVEGRTGSQYSVESGPTAFAWLMMVAGLVAALFLVIGDRVPSLTAPLFTPAPPPPWAYLPPPNGGTGAYPAPNAGGGYPPPAYPAPHVGAPMVGVPAHVPAPDAASGSGSAANDVGASVAHAPGEEFAQYWFAVPQARPLAPTEGLDKTPVGTLETGQWYLAVAPHPGGVLVEADGVRGVLGDVSGIQRGE